MRSNTARRRWRVVPGTYPQEYAHVQDCRYRLSKRGYGPPSEGSLTLHYGVQGAKDHVVVAGSLSWDTAIDAMNNHRNGSTAKRRKRRKH